LVAKGAISIFKQSTSSEQLQVAEIKAGGSIGEMGMLNDEPISATAIASVDSIVFILSGADFKKLVFENERIGVKLLWNIAKIVSVRLKRTSGLLAEISISDSDNN